MVYIVIDTGSRAKGYAVESSDFDFKVYTKCSREQFELYIQDKQILKNTHKRVELCNVIKTETSHQLCDVVYIDLYVGMIGIVTGKNPELGVFVKEHDVKNEEDDTVNTPLYEFIKQLTHLSMCAITTTMMKYAILRTNKNLLQLMFNYVYVEYYLKHGKAPSSTRILDIVHEMNDTPETLYVDMYAKLMKRETCDAQDVIFFEQWKSDILQRLKCTCNAHQQAVLRHNVVMYALNLQKSEIKPCVCCVNNYIFPKYNTN
ncbi:HE65 [Erinnyis ello granulovirus]|uniref:HE65 n=1 Tax=Erinnyis ello granulovirus TaxID=307444 RepID=A0A097DAJ0_9BBAC|nr:HE65 [Erinnyis ello granulovirus]AIS92036.1 HE65 [Erinnyis ello granulovirus]ARX71375.1 he65 [Erinnyis ello granulovirus]ARX71505.1 he65 [Erinnyis ello granulovirus]ARX71635.1 he65 [Erinnyis ello granulovirus]ARX71765.1 he65 [Erinnyis ello granulovirus]